MHRSWKLSEELAWRGFVNQTTYPEVSALDAEPITFYWGVDPSSDSMQIGNLAAAMMVRHFIDHGHKAYLLVGGATGMIGDPKDDEERRLKGLDEIEKNKAAIASQYDRIFRGQPYEIVDNYDWFKDMGYLQFLREIGKQFSMTQLLDREFVRSRVGENKTGLSYAEFSYSLIQGYDFLHLFRTKGVSLQVCGADQWGNSLAGVEMIRKLEGKTAHIYSVPLIVNKATGVKFGKSEEGAIWLDERKTSVYQFYQFWLNLDDMGVGDYIKIYTLIKPDEFDKLIKEFEAHPGNRAAQKYLAYEVTKLVHGEGRADAVKKVTDVLFDSANINELSSQETVILAAELPTSTVGKNIVEILTDTQLAASNGEARRLIESGAIVMNGTKIFQDQTVSQPSLLRKGKNSFALVLQS